MHARKVSTTNFFLDFFKIAAVSKESPQRLRREEFRYTEKYKTNSLDWNRYKSLIVAAEYHLYNKIA